MIPTSLVICPDDALRGAHTGNGNPPCEPRSSFGPSAQETLDLRKQVLESQNQHGQQDCPYATYTKSLHESMQEALGNDPHAMEHTSEGACDILQMKILVIHQQLHQIGGTDGSEYQEIQYSGVL